VIFPRILYLLSASFMEEEGVAAFQAGSFMVPQYPLLCFLSMSFLLPPYPLLYSLSMSLVFPLYFLSISFTFPYYVLMFPFVFPSLFKIGRPLDSLDPVAFLKHPARSDPENISSSELLF